MPRPQQPCGTEAAYRRHRKNGEPPCAECKTAHTAYCTAVRTGTLPPRKLKPCGTSAAYKRHRNRGEQPCAACTEAERIRGAGRRTAPGATRDTAIDSGREIQPLRELMPCGTDAAYRRHLRRGEQACGPCMDAQRIRAYSRRGTDSCGELTEDWRPIRNGLPDFVPYVYRGRGYDQLTGEVA